MLLEACACHSMQCALVKMARGQARAPLPPTAFIAQKQQERDAEDAKVVLPHDVRGMTREEAYAAPSVPMDPTAVPGSPGGPVLPPELKAYFYELMLAASYYGFLAEILGTHPVFFGADFVKAFHEFALSPEQWYTCAQWALDPTLVLDDACRAPPSMGVGEMHVHGHLPVFELLPEGRDGVLHPCGAADVCEGV